MFLNLRTSKFDIYKTLLIQVVFGDEESEVNLNF